MTIPPIGKCEHGVHLDSECGECIEDAQIAKAGKERFLSRYFTGSEDKVCKHGVPFDGPIGCDKCYEEKKNTPFNPYDFELDED